MNRFEFSISLSAQECLRYYGGSINKVVAKCFDGRTVQFPAALLTPFVTGSGVHGAFVMTCDSEGKGAKLNRR
jgi:hypothetical protein